MNNENQEKASNPNTTLINWIYFIIVGMIIRPVFQANFAGIVSWIVASIIIGYVILLTSALATATIVTVFSFVFRKKHSTNE